MTDFNRGTSVTIQVSNRPWIDKTIPVSSNDFRNADIANITVYDPCGLMFIDCPMIPCSDQIGWYLFRIQTDDTFPLGVYKVVVKLENTVPEIYGVCAGTCGTSGVSTSGTSGTLVSNTATSVSTKTFRLIDGLTT